MKSKKITGIKNEKKNVFSQFSDDWWNPDGQFEALHSFNNIRIKFILNSLRAHSINFRKNIRILDIGCGGGILTEPLARMGADVVGIDSNKKAIETAKNHSKKNNLKIKYYKTNIINFKQKEKFDLITCMEVIEHLSDVESFLEKLKSHLVDGGVFCGSTINKTLSSYFLGIIVAESLLRLVPKNTHQWRMFLKPNKLKKILFLNNFKLFQCNGVTYNPISKNWRYISNTNVNYLFSALYK